MKRLLLAVALVLCLCAWPTINMTGNSTPPSSGYAWSLGDLTADAARLTDAVIWDTGEWADPYDTVEELTDLGWTSHTVNATSCSNTSDDADEASLRSGIDGVCDPGNLGNTNCGNKIIVLNSSCHYDMTAGAGNSDSAPALDLVYSNVAYVGGGMNSTYIDCNDTGIVTSVFPPCVGVNGAGPAYGVSTVGSTYTWASGSSVGTTQITLTDPGDACAGFADNDRIVMRGVGPDGQDISNFNEVDSRSGCTINLVDPIRYDIPTRTDVREVTAANARNVFFFDLTVAFPNAPDGTAVQGSPYSGASMQFKHTDNLLISGVRIGPYVQSAVGTNGHFHLSIRHSEIGPSQFSKRRGNNGQVWSFGRSYESGSFSVFDNVFTDAAKRFISVNQMSSLGSWYGFNYMTDMTATAPLESGDHYFGVTNPQGIAPFSDLVSNERTVFFGHDGNDYAKQGALLVEANDMGGKIEGEATSGNHNRYTTFYRNRISRTSRTVSVSAGYTIPYMNWIANRFYTINADSSVATNALGRWNVSHGSAGAFTATGSTWPTSSTYKNYVETGPHDDYPLPLGIPPSLALKQDNAPGWWCTQSGPWNGDWSFGYGDGGDNGGTPRKLPAQIRYESGTCTAP